MGRGEGVLGGDVVAVGREAAEVAGAGADELRPPVREVRGDLDADAREQLAGRLDEGRDLGDAHLAGPGGERELGVMADAGAPVVRGGGGRDVGRLLAVVAAVGDEVLQDHLLQMAVAVVQLGERLQRRDAVLGVLADADQDAAGEGDLELAGVADRLQAQLRILGWRGGVGEEVGAQRLEHQPLGGRHLAQAGKVSAREGAEVCVRQEASREGLLAGPDDVGDEVLEAERCELCLDAGVVGRVIAGQDEELLDAAVGRFVEQRQNLFGLVQVALMSRKGAVLAVRDAGARERQRDIAREGHSAPSHGVHR